MWKNCTRTLHTGFFFDLANRTFFPGLVHFQMTTLLNCQKLESRVGAVYLEERACLHHEIPNVFQSKHIQSVEDS